jgi:hypothetical protein
VSVCRSGLPPGSADREDEFISQTLNPNLQLIKGLTLGADYPAPTLSNRHVLLHDLFQRVERAGGFASVSQGEKGWEAISAQFDLPQGTTEQSAAFVLREVYDRFLLPLQLTCAHPRTRGRETLLRLSVELSVTFGAVCLWV